MILRGIVQEREMGDWDVVAEFIAVDSAGREHVLYVRQKYESVKGAGPGPVVRRSVGLSQVVTRRGRILNRVDRGVYQVAGPGSETYRSDDPGAP